MQYSRKEKEMVERQTGQKEQREAVEMAAREERIKVTEIKETAAETGKESKSAEVSSAEKTLPRGLACLADESGIGVVEIILILVILIGLVVIFKSQITAIVETVFEAITSGVSEVVE